MANLKEFGSMWDASLIVETGTTITAGTLIWADISGTNVVRTVRSFSAVTPESANPPTGLGAVSLDGQLHNGATGVFLGVMANTQTGAAQNAGGTQTGVTWYTKGVFQFKAIPATASCVYRVGFPVYAVDRDTVRCAWSGVTTLVATHNATGTIPIGIVSYIPSLTGQGGSIITGSTIDVVRVKLVPFPTLQRFA